ncbi:MAG TPA: hypothetical protein VLG67_01940 [Candidatus Saccharimonadales bacterium]|nr:hypothetical protein [Candidatus Saccharimonadales bacterium]
MDHHERNHRRHHVPKERPPQESDIRQTSEMVLLRNRGSEPHIVLASREFRNTIQPQEQLNWLYLFATHETVEDIIVASNQHLVRGIAANARVPVLTDEEKLIGGNKGLLRAIRGFDLDTRSDFTTAAKMGIREGIQRTSERKHRVKKADRNLTQAYYLMDIFANEYSKEPNSHELRRQLLANTDLTRTEISKVIAAIYGIDTHPDNDGKKAKNGNALHIDEKAVEPEKDREEVAILERRRQVMVKARGRLTDIEQELIGYLFKEGIKFDLNTSVKLLKETLLKLRDDPEIQDLKQEESVATLEASDVKSSMDAKNMPGEGLTLSQLIGNAKSNLERVKALRAAGYSIKQTHEAIGLPMDEINDLIKQHIKDLTKTHGLLSRKHVTEWVEKEGMTVAEIASMLELSAKTVTDCLAVHIENRHLEPEVRRDDLTRGAENNQTKWVRSMIKTHKRIFDAGSRNGDKNGKYVVYGGK